MQHAAGLSCIFAVAVGLLAGVPEASAEDTLKLAVTQRGAWDVAAPELGQQAGIFKKHGILLELLYANGNEASELPVIAGSVDVGLAVGVMEVLRAYVKGAPLRIIGANRTGSAGYWYVPTSSSIKTVKDVTGRTIAYPIDGEMSRYDVFDLMYRYGIKARPMPTAGAAATLNEVTSGHVDVGWAIPPFGIDAIEHGQIRVVARANDVPAIRDKTARVMIATADTLQRRKDVIVRFMQAYRETVEWMYSGSAAFKPYGEFAGIPEIVARRLRDDFFAKSLLSPDRIVGLNAITKEALSLRYIRTSLTKAQVADLIQIPRPQGEASVESLGGWLRVFSPR
jgi:NitT/TauT family transport system substrate-binding protein